MSQLPSLSDSTPNYGMPMLFAGQAQKEFMINKSLSILDAIMPSSIIESLSAPPNTWTDGSAYRVTATATEGWATKEDMIAIAVAGSWHFLPPYPGMRVFDQAADCMLLYRSAWQFAVEPTAPSSGAVVDDQARAAILQIVAALRDLGLLKSR